MYQKLLLPGLITSILLMQGCSDRSSSTNNNTIENKKYIVIIHKLPSNSSCYNFKDILNKEGLNDIMIKETNLNTTCKTFERENDGKYCLEIIYSQDSEDRKNCVIGSSKNLLINRLR